MCDVEFRVVVVDLRFDQVVFELLSFSFEVFLLFFYVWLANQLSEVA